MQRYDASQLSTTTEVDNELNTHRDNLYKKTKFLQQTKQAKKEAAAGFRDQLQVINEELDTEVAIIDSLLDRKKMINA